MAFANQLISDFNQILQYGEQVRFKYYTQSLTGEYDDDIILTQSGTDYWTSGFSQPIKSNEYTSEGVLLQQGKIFFDDKKLYVDGNVPTSSLSQIKVGLGSPVSKEYQVLGDNQITAWEVNGTPIYKKLYIRYLNTGSFIGE